MTRRTQDDWRKLIQQQAKGKLSVAEFCERHGLGQTYFYKRKSDLKRHAEIAPPQEKRFIKVSKPIVSQSYNASITIKHQQSQLCLPMDTSPLWLAEFIKALA
nr:hypothetical protein [Pseudodesulfovibrio sp.]